MTPSDKSAACVCGEINTRHCPVHGQGESAAYSHRSEKMRQAFGFSRLYWYGIAPVELRIRHLIWKLSSRV